MPPFIIFGDATLREMCALRPTSEHEMRRVKGVGDAKLEKYGEAFAEAIRNYAEG
ncbi:HRDC domain-containing protein [Cohnella rhizosphaerae]|uniref:HRDC domain-containing protein n=1 Tax=Cohnella rhizosphaerae TaxID=1457232 RepID=UPI0030B8DB4A